MFSKLTRFVKENKKALAATAATVSLGVAAYHAMKCHCDCCSPCVCDKPLDWEEEYDLNKVYELRCKTTCYFGCGAIHKIDSILDDMKKRGITKILVVSSKTAYKKCGAWAVVEPSLKKHEIDFEVFNDFKPNPNSEDVDSGAEMGRKLGAQAVLTIGGGSAIDGAKAIAVLLHESNEGKTAEELMLWKFSGDNAVPLIAINTTHGTGTEVDRFAVVSVLTDGKKFKPLITPESIYPIYAIDDPNLMKELNLEQTIYTSIDAFTHSIETATTKTQSPYSIQLAKDAIRLIAKYLPMAKQDREDVRARYWLLYASCIAGIAFDNSLLHLVHALEHPLSAKKPNLFHGLGLGLILPSVIDSIYHTNSKIIADCLKPIVPGANGQNTENEKKKVVKGLENWLKEMGVSGTLKTQGFTFADIEELSDLALNTPSLGVLVGMAPIPADKNVISSIYKNAMSLIYE